MPGPGAVTAPTVLALACVGICPRLAPPECWALQLCCVATVSPAACPERWLESRVWWAQEPTSRSKEGYGLANR